MKHTPTPAASDPATGGRGPAWRRLSAAFAAAALCCLTVSCPEEKKTLAQLQARQAQLETEMQAALKRNDMDAFWRINHEQTAIRDGINEYYGARTGVQAGMIIARIPEEALEASRNANKTAVQNAANAAASQSAQQASQNATQVSGGSTGGAAGRVHMPRPIPPRPRPHPAASTPMPVHTP